MRTWAWMLALVVLCLTGLPLFAQHRSNSAGSDGEPPPETEDITAEPGDEGKLRRIARRLGSMASPDDGEGLSVSAGIIVAGSHLSGGLGYRRLDLFKDVDIELEGMVSLRRYQDYRAAIGLLGTRSSTLELDVADSKATSLFNASSRKAPGAAVFLDLRFRDYPRHTYYGTGIESRQEDRADYALRGISVDGVWQWQVARTVGLSVRGGLLNLEVDRGHDDALLDVEARFPPALLPGASTEPRFLTYGGGIALDTRQEPGAPDDGGLLAVSVRRFSASDTPQLSFTRLTIDARGYRAVPPERGVLAARGLVSSDLTGAAGATPFYLLQSLGGSETLRGFHSYRFPDHVLAHVSVEYRWRAHRFVEVAPLFDVGTVAPAMSRLSLGALKMSPGVGIRARTNRRALARLDWAWGSEGHRVVLGTGPAF